MKLFIGDTVPADGEAMYLPYSLMEDKAVHLFIASNVWDTLTVEISDKMPEGVLKYMILKCSNKEVVLPDRKMTQKEIGLVCEMFPDRAGTIRRAYMMERPIAELLL